MKCRKIAGNDSNNWKCKLFTDTHRYTHRQTTSDVEIVCSEMWTADSSVNELTGEQQEACDAVPESSCALSCKAGYESQGTPRLECTAAGWQINSPCTGWAMAGVRNSFEN